MLANAGIAVGILVVCFLMAVCTICLLVTLFTKCEHYYRIEVERGVRPSVRGYLCHDCGAFLSSKERDDMVYGHLRTGN